MKVFPFLVPLLLCGLQVQSHPNPPSLKKLHERMTPSQLRRIFHVFHPSQVPEYELVHVRSLHKRSTDQPNVRTVNLSAFGRRLRLRLKKNREFENKIKSLKVISVKTSKDGLKFTEEKPQKEDHVGTTYHDDKEMAAVLVRHADDGSIELDGTIGNELVIRPAPKPLFVSSDDEGYVDDEMFLDEEDALNSTRHELRKGAHIVYRRPQNNSTERIPGGDYLALESLYKALRKNDTRNERRRTKRRAPETVWPEVLVVLDYETFRLHNRDSRELKRYFVAFWNGVDLRYKMLTYPRVRVSLAGMIVAKDKDATPYLEQNRLHAPNADAVDAAASLTDMGKYLYREDRLPSYDLAVLITKLDMCRRQFEGGRCGRGTAGFAYVGGACVVNKRLEKVNSVAIIEDSGGYSGIIVAAHEVGHLLGCVHDGSPAPSYLGGPGATRCPWEDGFIMSDLRHTERGFRWSTCSVEQFKHFLNGETAGCLFNYPQDNQLLSRSLPGASMSLDEQCKKDRGTQACFKDARVCAQLFCYDTASGYCVSYRPAAEGSSCGDGQVCRNGKCTVDVENIIPDYSQVTQTFTAERRADIPRISTATRTSSTTKQPSTFRTSTRTHSFRLSTRKPLFPSSTPLSIQRLNSKDTHGSCEDQISHLSGGLTCKEFLQRYGYRYCRHQYLKQRCCSSHRQVCDGKS